MQSAAKHLYLDANQCHCNEAVKMLRCALHDPSDKAYSRVISCFTIRSFQGPNVPAMISLRASFTSHR
jgi:hypothetical protein